MVELCGVLVVNRVGYVHCGNCIRKTFFLFLFFTKMTDDFCLFFFFYRFLFVDEFASGRAQK